MTHTELAERIEREGASRELDALIAGTDPATVQWHSEDETPAYTSSLDAAMTLVPEGCFPSVSQNVRTGDWRAWVATVRYDKWNRPHYNHAHAQVAPTPAAALCAAALRAKDYSHG